MNKNRFLPIFLCVMIVGFLFFSFALDLIKVHPSTVAPFFTAINEDVPFNYSLALNVSLAGGVNITQFNVTLPNEFTFTYKTNGSTITKTSAFTNSSTTLSWTNTSSWLVNYSTNNTRFWFNVTSANPGYYNFTIAIVNISAGVTARTLYFNVSVSINDTTSPDVHTSNFTSLVAGGSYSGTIVLNASIMDNFGAGSSVKVFFNITNASASVQQNITNAINFTIKDWNATFDTTSLGDGLYNITIWANDSNKNLNNSAYLTIRIDNTAPTASMSCTPTSVHVGDIVTCSCSPSDSGSGINSSLTSYTINPSTANTGAFTQTCSFTDLAGKGGTTTSNSYTVELSGSGPSTGSPGTTIPSTTKTTTIASIIPGTPSVITAIDGSTNVKEITIEVSSTASNVKVTVTKYDSQPTAVSVEKSDAYKYLQINTQNLADKLSKAIVKIYVAKSWVSSQGIAKEDVVLSKYDSSVNQWNELTTTYNSEDDSNYYYTVELTSFSYFAISPKETAVVSTEEPQTTSEEDTTELFWWVWIIIGVVIVAVIIGGRFFLKKKRK